MKKEYETLVNKVAQELEGSGEGYMIIFIAGNGEVKLKFSGDLDMIISAMARAEHTLLHHGIETKFDEVEERVVG